MDAFHQLLQPNDSFSYAWLVDVKSFSSAAAAAVVGDSQRSHDDGAGSFIEIDPDGLFFSMRWLTQNEDDFDFSLLQPQCSSQVHADQIFSSGYLLPLLDGQLAAVRRRRYHFRS